MPHPNKTINLQCWWFGYAFPAVWQWSFNDCTPPLKKSNLQHCWLGSTFPALLLMLLPSMPHPPKKQFTFGIASILGCSVLKKSNLQHWWQCFCGGASHVSVMGSAFLASIGNVSAFNTASIMKKDLHHCWAPDSGSSCCCWWWCCCSSSSTWVNDGEHAGMYYYKYLWMNSQEKYFFQSKFYYFCGSPLSPSSSFLGIIIFFL